MACEVLDRGDSRESVEEEEETCDVKGETGEWFHGGSERCDVHEGDGIGAWQGDHGSAEWGKCQSQWFFRTP